MKKTQGVIFIWLLTIALTNLCFGQDTKTKNLKVGASIMSENINIPFNKTLGEKFHLGAMLNIEMSKERDGIYQFGNNFNLGYFHHKDFFRAGFFNYKAIYSLLFWQTIQFDLPIGIGYAHSFSTEQGYVLKDGTYQKNKSNGKPHLMPSIGCGMTLKLEGMTDIPLEFFGHYELFSLLPYAPSGGIPFTPHSSLNVGLKYQIK